MDKDDLKRKKVSFRKSGSGSMTPSITIPITWLREMGIDMDNREIVVYKHNNSIVIRKDV